MFTEKDFYYCYSTNLFKFLKHKKGISFICSGLHEKTLCKFWQFQRTDELLKALEEYNKCKVD